MVTEVRKAITVLTPQALTQAEKPACAYRRDGRCTGQEAARMSLQILRDSPATTSLEKQGRILLAHVAVEGPSRRTADGTCGDTGVKSFCDMRSDIPAPRPSDLR